MSATALVVNNLLFLAIGGNVGLFLAGSFMEKEKVMGYGPSSCPRCGELTTFYPELYDEHRPLCKSCECDDLKAENEKLREVIANGQEDSVHR